MIGKVKKLKDKKGYGFIEYSDNEDVFLHYSAIELDGCKTLLDGKISHYEFN